MNRENNNRTPNTVKIIITTLVPTGRYDGTVIVCVDELLMSKEYALTH